jgi:hypothetical protein
MPKGTRVSRCINKLKKSNRGVNPYAVCQASTKQSYATGKSLKEDNMINELSKDLLRRATKAAQDKVVDADITSDIHDLTAYFKKPQGVEIAGQHDTLSKMWKHHANQRNDQASRFRVASKGVRTRRPPRGYPLGDEKRGLDNLSKELHRKTSGREDSSVNNFEKMLTSKLLKINEVGETDRGKMYISQAYRNRQKKTQTAVDVSKNPASQAVMGKRGLRAVAGSLGQLHKVDHYMSTMSNTQQLAKNLGIGDQKSFVDPIAGENARKVYRVAKQEVDSDLKPLGKRTGPMGKELEKATRRGRAAEKPENN